MLVDTLQSRIDEIDGMESLIPVEEYLPPHKMASFTPYDGIITLHEVGRREPWTESDVGDALEECEIPYQEVIGVTENDSREPGDKMAFVQFRNPSR